MHARARTRKWQPHPYRVAVSSVNHGRGSGTRSMVQHLWRHASARCWERPPRPRPASSDSEQPRSPIDLGARHSAADTARIGPNSRRSSNPPPTGRPQATAKGNTTGRVKRPPPDRTDIGGARRRPES